MFGINLSGAEFGTGSRYGYDYLYPSSADLDRYKAAGMELVRLPFKWERMQPTLNGPLSSAELGRLTAFLDAAEARGMKVVLDLHNYGRFGGAVIGSPESEPVEPTTDPAVREIYDRRYRVFKSLYPTLRELFGELRDRATESGGGQDSMKDPTSETRTATVTWSVCVGGLGKQA